MSSQGHQLAFLFANTTTSIGVNNPLSSTISTNRKLAVLVCQQESSITTVER